MTLTLHHTEIPVHTTAAAFIRGGSAMEWLAEISRFNVPLSSLECYILPASIRSVEASGLLVIFKETKAIENSLLPDAYGVLAGKLYLPVHSQLYPQVTETELQRLLLWPVQVFHPTIGFVGFEEKERLNLSELFTYTLPLKTTWRHAHPGLPARPPLQQIMVQQPTPQEIIQSVKDSLGNKSLEDIPGATEGKTTAIEKLLNSVKYGLFNGLLSLSKAFGSAGSGGSGSSFNLDNSKPGLLDRLMTWMAKNMEAIERKRQDEIQRLLSLFDKDNDEALQYAIPLDSPYLNRGEAPPSARLGLRSVNFNLGKLGGGGRVDSWDIGEDYRQSLRSKYLASAQAALERGDYRKAAYVHAHLLGDYHAAANVLVQGKFYREAAALYKDHLKNIPAAAECLENGGLLMEATELYIELDRLEKAGDLYHQMEQPQQANTCYETVVTKLLGSNDHLEASRLLHDKINAPERAKQTLLAGWESTNRAEACLKKYYDLVAQTESENLVHHLENVYAKRTTPDTRFLNVLVHVKEKHDAAGVAQTAQKMAYEIVSRQATTGDTSGLHQLKTFVPDDRLIASDASRYAQSRPKPQQTKPGTTLQLDKTIKWLSATWHRNQLIAIGIKNGQARLARANWYENVEYYSWAESVGGEEGFSFIGNNYYSNELLLWNRGKTSLPELTLPKNKYFNEELKVGLPVWLSDKHSRMVNNNEGIVVMNYDHSAENISMNQHNSFGALMKVLSFKKIGSEHTVFFRNHSILDFWNDQYFINGHTGMVVMNENGTHSCYDPGCNVFTYALCKVAAEPLLVVSTNAGCKLLTVKNGELVSFAEFETSDNPDFIRFISADKFILVVENTVDIYKIIEDSVLFIREIKTTSPIIESIPVPHQNQFGLIEQNGTVSLHDY